jgi:hypothetical protein
VDALLACCDSDAGRFIGLNGVCRAYSMESTKSAEVLDGTVTGSDPSAYVASVANSLIEEALEERREILNAIEDVEERLSLARRRIAAADASLERNSEGSMTGASPELPWISSGRDLARLKRRLEDAVDDESILVELAGEVRREKERRTEMALKSYARRTRALLTKAN